MVVKKNRDIFLCFSAYKEDRKIMIPLKVRRYRFTSIFLIGCFIAACAGSPNEEKARNPKVGNDTYTIEEDGLLSVGKEQGLLSNDTPEEGQNAVVVTTNEEQTTDKDGVVTMATDGSFNYEPAPNFNGKDQINYLVENEKGRQSQGTVFFEVTPVNDPPEPQDDIVRTSIEEALTISVLDNDSDPDGDKIHLVSVAPPNIGTAQANNNGTVVYTPPANHEGEVRVRYTVADSADEQAEAWISINIVDRNQNIEANPDDITLTEDTPNTFPTSDLLANDHNFLNGALSVASLGEAQHGMVELSGEAFTYTPSADFSGNDTFTYTVQSEADATASSTVNVTVTPVNDPPTISQIPDQTLMAGDTANVPFTIEDLDNDFSELTVIAEVSNSAPPSLLTDDRITLSGSGEQRTLQIATNPTFPGTANIAVSVNDGQEPSSQPFLLTVTPLAGDTPLYRFYNSVSGDHLYKTSSNAPGNYKAEGPACYVFATQRPGTVPLYRFYNSNTGDHLYKTDGRAPINYRAEGPACYVFNAQRPGTVPLQRYWNAAVSDHYYIATQNLEETLTLPGVRGRYIREIPQGWVNIGPPIR